MKALPGDVYVTGQLTPEQIEALAARGIKSILNNRPDGEAPAQPTSLELETAASDNGVSFGYIPMAGYLTPQILTEASRFYKDEPRPIVAFCTSGTRSAALWAFAHVRELGVDATLEAMEDAGFVLPQLRAQLTQWAEADDG